MIRFLGTRNCLIFWRWEIRQPWILAMYTHTPRHALCEKRRAVTSPWVGSRAISLRALTLALVWLLFTVTVQRRPPIFPLDDIPPTLYGLHHQGQSPPATRVIVGMKTACSTHGCTHQYLSVPMGKAKSHHHLPLANLKHKPRTNLCSQPNSYEVFFSSATFEPSPPYHRDQEVAPEGSTQ